MPGPWVTPEEIKGKLRDRLSVVALDSKWDNHVTDGIAAGHRDIKNILVARGYTESQLDSWDDRHSYSVDQTMFWVLVNGAGLGGWSDQDYNKLDHRKELQDAKFPIMIGGVPVYPSAGDPAGSTGTIRAGGINLKSGGVDLKSTAPTYEDRFPYHQDGRGYPDGQGGWERG